MAVSSLTDTVSTVSDMVRSSFYGAPLAATAWEGSAWAWRVTSATGGSPMDSGLVARSHSTTFGS
ncbi:hypothetical protein PTT_14417 [Pyrenophora teres f. teres 0-1]|uniref:Uncharacterized protein n=1 Tax=Pyrenophora teres f. teres (strain 0-1) TaxID=861557 RepID=E3RY44_PYRTT|nr:hypothetical protein PTT_14417 [Pyrenophora teres f. teres 0-1]